MRSIFVAAATAIVLYCNPAGASLVDRVATTLDTSTGLEWLDVPLSQNLSYNDVKGQFASGGLFEGFRYATSSELLAFFGHAGLNLGLADYAAAIAFQALVGVTGISSPIDFGDRIQYSSTTVGLLDSESIATTAWGGINSITEVFDSGAVVQTGRGFHDPVLTRTKSQPDVSLGSWLVRDAALVPEPPALLLVSIALLALGASSISRR